MQQAAAGKGKHHDSTPVGMPLATRPTHRVACQAANSSRPSVAMTDRRWNSTVAGEAYSRFVTTCRQAAHRQPQVSIALEAAMPQQSVGAAAAAACARPAVPLPASPATR